MPSSPSSNSDAAELRRRLTRDPTVDPTGPQDPADEFCRLACLVYSELDGPDRWARAREILAAHPEIVAASIAAAAAAADPDAIAALLAGDPRAATVECGPHRWTPLMYLTYSRAPTDDSSDRVLRTARSLLDAGADANTGYLWQGLVPPFTALTGVFGEGEQGAGKQPPHPHAEPLARLLLTAGADPNDGQTLYNRMFRPEDDFLLLLFEFGLGRISTGPWKSLLGDHLDTPAEMLATLFGWAIDNCFAQRVELLIANGIDVLAPLADGRTPAEHAIAAGDRDVIADLRIAGAEIPASDELTLVGALLAGDSAVVAEHTAMLREVLGRHPALIHRVRKPSAVAVLAAAGFDLNALHNGVTAMHEAAFAGNTELISALLQAGASPTVIDNRFGATPLGWAQYSCWPTAAVMLADAAPG